MIKVLPWTWTKLNDYENCPYRHLKVMLQKQYVEDKSDQLDWGQRVHNAFERAVPKNEQLPPEMAPWQKYITRLHATPGEILVEQKYALSKALVATEYYAPTAWYRGKADVTKIMAPVALAVDWKTGNYKPPNPLNMQLMLMAACVLAHHPEIELVQSRFIWLASGEEDDQLWTRQTVAEAWASNLLPRVERMLSAATTDTYPPKPGGLCKQYCPVQVCEFWKKGSR